MGDKGEYKGSYSLLYIASLAREGVEGSTERVRCSERGWTVHAPPTHSKLDQKYHHHIIM
jgi:hypothetical protein